MSEVKLRKFLRNIQKNVSEDVEHRKKAEEYTRKYGTLTEKDLRKRFTI